MIENSKYKEKIKNEAKFWDERAEVLLSSGRIPLWFDHRRGEDVSFIPLTQLKGAGIRANPTLYRIVFEDMIDTVIKEITQKKGNILDLGCGSGWFSLELARIGMSVDGYDISPKQIQIAKKYSKESQQSSDPLIHGNFGHTNYEVKDLNKIVLEKEKYDAATSFGTLHHIQFLNHLLCEVYKSLKPDGKFIFYEHIGYKGFSRIFPIIFKIIGLLPKLKNLFTHAPNPNKTSPFEGVSEKDVIDMVKDKFVIKRMEYKFLFLPVVISRLRIYRLPKALSIPLIKTFYFIDKTLIKSKIFKGPFVFVIASKNHF